MSTSQYIGARYVPLFAEPVEWNTERTYEPLTIVIHEGNSYTSRQFVPKGVAIDDYKFWALTGNYNAQVEQYRQDVRTYDERIKSAKSTADNALSLAKTNETDIAGIDSELAGTAESGLKTLITNEATNREHAISAEADARQHAISAEADARQHAISAEADARQQADTTLQNKINTLTVNKSIMLAFGDSFGDETGEWADLVSKKLGKQLDNFCLGGAVWPFDTKLNEAIAKYNTDEMRDKIAFAVAYGGINQTVFNPYENASTIKTFITKFNNSFPGVPLFIAPLNNCNPYNTNFPNAFRNTLLSAPIVYRELRTFEGNFILLEGSIWYNTGSNSLWNYDKLHPNADGSKAIANNMVAAMFGNNTIYQELQPIGEWFGTNIIIEEPGYITQTGIMTPRIRINVNTPSIFYFASNGFRIGNKTPIVWYDYNDTTNEATVKNTTFVPHFYSDNNNMQMYIDTSGLQFDLQHHAIIPPQFIPFGIIPAKESK